MGCFSGRQGPPPPPPGGGSTPTNPGSPSAGCCPTSVAIKAPDGTSNPCRIVPANGSLRLRAVPQPAGSGRRFRWSTSSTKIRLENDTGQTVTVRGRGNASAAIDAETLVVACTAPGCGAVTSSVRLTVVKVTFSKSNAQTYGYDDMDTPAAPTDHHVSVKKLATTQVHTRIEGGLNGTQLEFVCDDNTIANPGAAPASADFDLPVDGGDTDKGETVLRARVRCTCPARDCTSIKINTYAEKPVDATVAKVHDSGSARTALRFPNLDAPGTATLINTKYKEGVALMTLTDHSGTGGATNVHYDLDSNGSLTYDIVNGGGPEFNKIKRAFAVAGWRVVIVRTMVSLYYLASAAARGATTITINTADHFYTAGDTTPLGTGGKRENVTIQSFVGATLTLAAPLQHAHSRRAPIEFPAAGWSGNPVVIVEGTTSEDEIKWTIGHELGHSVLSLVDVTHDQSIMHFMQGAADTRLRYKPLPKHYDPGTENQWETIPRP
ncbi:MAG: hypothetical protein M0Z38_04415 [Deltaproteobacteria bacterium]|nr:hypothetical protein [Deltaproteobacteria bacterium]